MKINNEYSADQLNQLDEIVEILRGAVSIETDKYAYNNCFYEILNNEGIISVAENDRNAQDAITYVKAEAGSVIKINPTWTFSEAYGKAKKDREKLLGNTYIDQSQIIIMGDENKVKSNKRNQQGNNEMEKQSIWDKVINAVCSFVKLK